MTIISSLLLALLLIIWINPEETGRWAVVLLLPGVTNLFAWRYLAPEDEFLYTLSLVLIVSGASLWVWTGIWQFKLLPQGRMKQFSQFQNRLWIWFSRWV
jgi:hypothetical protein